jgi:DNA modification methylase
MVAPITQFKPNPNNPRIVRDDKFKKLVKSIQDFPEMLVKRPLVCFTDIDGKYVILGGNMRHKAAIEAGMNELPYILADDWTQEQRDEFLIKDNVGFGEWDWDALANEWDADKLTEWGLDVPGFEVAPEAKEDDYEMPDEVLTDIVPGDLFQIGQHRLLCGDSTDSDQVEKLMNGQKADMAHNDPPYGMKKEKEGVLNDNLNYDDLLDFNREWIALQFMHLKENGSWYCWGIDEPLMDIYSGILKPYIKEQKATFRNLITWNKGGFGSGGGTGVGQAIQRSFFPGDEKCLFVMLGVQGFNNNSDNYFEGFEPIRNWLIKEKEKSGLTNEQLTKLTATTHTHYWSKSQWAFPTKEHYNTIKDAANGKAFVKEYEEIKKEYEEIKKEWYSTRAYFDNTHDMMTNVWEFARHRRDGTEGKHSTPKPIPLCERAIKSSCPDNGLVLDMFLGSGSTMVAAHQLKRKCYGMELDPKYCQVIIDRMRKLDPSLQIKRNGKLI